MQGADGSREKLGRMNITGTLQMLCSLSRCLSCTLPHDNGTGHPPTRESSGLLLCRGFCQPQGALQEHESILILLAAEGWDQGSLQHCALGL